MSVFCLSVRFYDCPSGRSQTNRQLRAIHARVERTTSAEGRRKSNKPLDRFSSPGTEGARTRGDSRFVMAPTSVRSAGRTSQTAQVRANLQLSRNSHELLRHLLKASEQNKVDLSVVGSAMQRCGQGRWWHALLEVRQVQLQHGLTLTPLQRNIYFTALARSVRGEGGFGPLPVRQRALITLGKEAWAETDVLEDTDATLSSSVGAVLTLCTAAKHADGFHWGVEVWQSLKSQALSNTPSAYEQYTSLLAVYKQEDQVNSILDRSSKDGWVPSCVLLGSLVNVAAEQGDWRRAEQIWKKLIKQMGVVPNSICFGARAKAHLLCGRPWFAANVTEEMLASGIALEPPNAESQFQSLLVVYHSSLVAEDLKRLRLAESRGGHVIQQSTALHRRTWVKLQNMADRLKAAPSSVRLHDVLVEWKAKSSIMASWENHKAGSAYLSGQPSSVEA